ncbi:MAG: hypothetical protein K2Y05_08265, partial [Hyphomicrobiaceae bacterium]|nr:hypothetical protein [Hyphomicrobiaceae bacterium]
AVFDLAALADTFQTVTGEILAANEDHNGGSIILTFATALDARARAGEITGQPQQQQRNRAFRSVIPVTLATVLAPLVTNQPVLGKPSEPASPTKQSRSRSREAARSWQTLVGAEVRVRGWIELRNGDTQITINHGPEIELLTAQSGRPATASPPKANPAIPIPIDAAR